MLIQGSPDLCWTFQHTTPKGEVSLSTDELREILGEDVPLSAPEVFAWMSGYLAEQEAEIAVKFSPGVPASPWDGNTQRGNYESVHKELK